MGGLESLNKGAAWEYRVRRAVFLSGWYVRGGIDLRELVNGSAQTLGELDVVGLDFATDLRELRLVGECKNRSGGAKEADRVVWLLGIAQVVNATRTLFAKPTLGSAIYEWASRLDVELWDEAAIQGIEKRVGVPSDDEYFGSWNPAASEGVRTLARHASQSDQRVKRAVDYLFGAFWFDDNAARTKRLKSYFDVISRSTSLRDAEKDVLVLEGLIALIAAATVAAGELSRWSPARGVVRLNDEFAAGVANASALRDIAARADDYYRDAFTKANRSRTSGRIPMDVPRLVDTVARPPEWLPEFLELSRSVGLHPRYGTDTLRFADLLIHENLLLGKAVSPAVAGSIVSPPEELLRLIQLAGHFLGRVWGVGRPAVEMLLSASSDITQAPPQRAVGYAMSPVQPALDMNVSRLGDSGVPAAGEGRAATPTTHERASESE